jgi:hypothetical protein
MLAAYLRDNSLIPPDYPQGFRSIVRQELVLGVMAAEDVARTHQLRFDLTSRLVSASNDAQGRAELMHQVVEAASYISAAKAFNFKGLEALNPMSRSGKMINLHKVLSKHNIVGDDSESFTEDDIRSIMQDLKEAKAEEAKAKEDAKKSVTS